MRKIRILCATPEPRDGTAWYRCVSPWGRLQEQYDDIEVNVTNLNVGHSEISRHDVLFLQRPVAPEHLEMLRIAKSHGLTVWVDWDDPYLNVPPNNPRYFVYKDPNVLATIRAIAQEADIVTVTTFQLQHDFRQLNPRTAMIPNGVDPRLTAQIDGRPLPTRRILWRGGDSHAEDLQTFGEAIVAAANADTAHHLWSWYGMTPHHIMSRLPYGTAQAIPWTDLQTYWRHLPNLRPNIVIVPLEETHFNKCKSNIAVLEGAWAGAAVLAPRWPDWTMPGVTTYDTPVDFEKKLIKLMNTSTADLAAKAAETWKFASDKYSVDVQNELRVKILRQLLVECAPKWQTRSTQNVFTQILPPRNLSLAKEENK